MWKVSHFPICLRYRYKKRGHFLKIEDKSKYLIKTQFSALLFLLQPPFPLPLGKFSVQYIQLE